MEVREGIGLLTGVLILAGLTVAIVNGTQTANVFSAGANGFVNMVKAATLQG